MQEIYQNFSSKERVIITITVMVGTFMAILDTTIVDVVLPKMMAPLSTDLYGIQWVITSYMIAAATSLLFVENFAKYIGYSYTFIVGMIIFTVSSFFCGGAQNLPEMIVFRSFQGIGEAFIMACAQTILFLIYPPHLRGTALGIYGLGVSFAPAIGPTLGGFITEHINWRWIFFINIPIGILNVTSSLFFLPKHLGRKKYFQFNFVSYFFISSATISLLMMLSKGQQLGWFQSTFIGFLFFICSISFCLFLATELYSNFTNKPTLIDWKIFKVPEYSLSMGFYFFVLGFGIYQIFYLLPLYYENLKGMTTFQAGLYILGPASLIGIFSIVSGILSDKLSPKLMIFFSWIAFLFVSFFLMPKLNYYTPSYKALLLTLPLGVCIGTFFAPLSTLAMGKLGELTGLGVALMHYIRFLGGSFGTALATNRLEYHTEKFFLRATELQNWIYTNNFITTIKKITEKLYPCSLAEKKAQALLYQVEYLQALSLSFQTTFKGIGFWGMVGGIPLILLLLLSILQYKKTMFNIPYLSYKHLPVKE